MSYNGKIALISGGTRGIGLNISKRLIQQGAFCYITGRNEDDGLLAQKELGPNSRFIKMDVTDEKAVDELFSIIKSEHGRLDFAVNNAGITTKRALVRELDIKEWKRVLDINLIGVLNLMSYQIKLMSCNEHGSIVNVSSCGGIQGQPRQSAYSTSKAALNMLTQVAAIECANPEEEQHVVRINAVCPGPTLGGMNTEERLKANPASTEEKIQSTAMKRFANPEEITSAIFWLLSEESSYVTGSLLSVDGGFIAGKF
ncbi:TPA: SDR family oxidoreductase [Providencia stuartii]|uniref:SDR family NAD(P)-dependent oxidoreductase n=1 Tax=Providencia stuartii TaxID=588 RepID=UPI00123BC925|nr:SDR family oxidoreductase [Providencia stuartii]QET97370.1 SDR family oxidoreductase [Providencia stuartii]UQZ12940.1 SDR family oxidoreductase [Providencia stuartii]HEM8145634.1 SDR family oxidoreductase [Providencia stuartii]HEM8876206.1 SDR family oxidoreductase [Providencia stuartii]